METTTISISNTYGTSLITKANKVLADIKYYVKAQNESVTDENLKLRVKPEFWDLRIDDSLLYLSKTKQKKLNKIIRGLERKQSVRYMNRFLHFISKNIIKDGNSIYINRCRKEDEIQRKRKAWVKARNEAELLLKAYKEEKGDYYKK